MAKNSLFEQLNSICKKHPIDRNVIEEQYIGNYMMLKWLSFCDCDDATYIKITKLLNEFNVYIFEDKWNSYLYLYNTVPKIPYIRFKYIKKPKTEPTKSLDKVLNFLSESLELSKRECKYIIDNNYVDVEQLKEIL